MVNQRSRLLNSKRKKIVKLIKDEKMQKVGLGGKFDKIRSFPPYKGEMIIPI
jgi:hypothetical protein